MPSRTVRRPRRAAVPLVLSLLAACAGPSGGPPAPVAEGSPALPDRFTIQYRADRGIHESFVERPVEEVADLLPEVYQHLGLPVAPASNTETLTFITPTLKIQGRHCEGELNSEYFDCGAGLRGRQADHLPIDFVAVTELLPDEAGGTVVRTLVDGTAFDRYRSTQSYPCRGTGKLEAQIAELLERRITG